MSSEELDETPSPEEQDKHEDEEVEANAEESQEEDEFSEDLLELAEVVGLDPADYDSERDLEKAIYDAAGESEQGSSAQRPTSEAKPKETAPEALALEAYEFELSDEDVDSKLIAELKKFSNVQTERFQKALAGLRESHAVEVAELKATVKRLTEVSAAHTRDQDFLLLDDWISGNPDAEAYFGKGRTIKLDPQSTHARRRRAQRTRAYRLVAKYAKNEKRVPVPDKLFDLAFAARRSSVAKAKDDKREKTPTQSARPTRSSAREGTARVGGLSEKAALREAGKEVEKWQRQHGLA